MRALIRRIPPRIAIAAARLTEPATREQWVVALLGLCITPVYARYGLSEGTVAVGALWLAVSYCVIELANLRRGLYHAIRRHDDSGPSRQP